MDSLKKRNLFLALILVLVAVIAAVSVVILARGPRESSVEVISHTGDQMEVNDLYDGKMIIPYFDIPTSQYKPDDFVEKDGVITYQGDGAQVGINVNSKLGEIDWNQVAANGVDFAMIRVGYRGADRGLIALDENFEANITGAIDAGLPVGVYFYSQAITDAEAEEEAAFVLEKIRGYSVTFPISINWEYNRKDDGTVDETSRTIQCNGDQVTGFLQTFCKKVESAGFTAGYYCDKEMGYEKLDLAQLKDYDMWYAEHKPAPSFHYDFKLWQYTKEGTVAGISQKVPVTIALRGYGS